MSRSIGRFFQHSAIYALGNALNRVGAFLLLPLYTRYLSVGQYGSLELYYSISAVVSSLLSVGIAHATLRFYYEYDEESDRRAVVSTNLIASTGICAVGGLLVGLVAGPVATAWLSASPSNLGLMLVLVTMVLELSSQVGLAYLRAREQSVMFISVSFAKLVLQCVVNALLLTRFNAGVEGVLFGNLLAVALGWLVVGGYTLRQCGVHFQVDKLMPVLKYSLPFLYISIIGAVSSNFDRFALNRLLSLEAVGIYALATKFSKLISDLLGEPFNRAYGAFRFSIMKSEGAAEMQANVLRYLSAALAVISLGIVYFTADVLRWVATPEYAGAAALMPMLVVAASVQMLIYLLQTGILVSKNTQLLVRVTLVRCFVVPVLGFPMIKYFGLQGACALQLVDAFVGATVTHRLSQRYFAVHYDYARLGVLVALGLAFFAAGNFVPAGWVGVTAKVGLMGLFTLAVLQTQLGSDEKQGLRAQLSARWQTLRGAV